MFSLVQRRRDGELDAENVTILAGRKVRYGRFLRKTWSPFSARLVKMAFH